MEEQIRKKPCNHILCHRLYGEAQCMGADFLTIQETPVKCQLTEQSLVMFILLLGLMACNLTVIWNMYLQKHIEDKMK